MNYLDAEAALEAETLVLSARLGWETLDCTRATSIASPCLIRVFAGGRE